MCEIWYCKSSRTSKVHYWKKMRQGLSDISQLVLKRWGQERVWFVATVGGEKYCDQAKLLLRSTRVHKMSLYEVLIWQHFSLSGRHTGIKYDRQAKKARCSNEGVHLCTSRTDVPYEERWLILGIMRKTRKKRGVYNKTRGRKVGRDCQGRKFEVVRKRKCAAYKTERTAKGKESP